MSIGTGLNFPVNSLVQQNDGKILVGGNFTNYKEVSQNSLMRLNSDKSKDNSFSIGAGFNDSVNSLALQNDGKIIVGGKFTKYQEAGQNYLIRLNTDGSKDSSFNIGTGFDNTVNFVTIQPDGKILVGGNFRKYQGISQNYLIRLNTDGTKDTTFNIGTGFYNSKPNPVNVVKTIIVQSDGKILVGGDFQKFASSNQDNFIRLNANGTKDTSFDIGSGFSSPVYSITLQPDKKILVGGVFSSYQGITHNNLIRLNTDASADNTFDAGVTFQNCFVYATILQNDGKIIVGSYSSSSNALTQNNLVVLNTNGSKDNSFGAGITFFNNNNTSATVYSILLQSNNQLLVGGDFTAYQGNNSSAYLIGITGTASNLSNEEFGEKATSFSIWPNPVKNTLNINSLKESAYSVKIYDLLGSEVLSKENISNNVDVSSFTSGLYLIKIKTETGETSQKFIKI